VSEPDDETLSIKLIDLESRLMHQEKLLEQLDEVVTAQQDQLDRLRREVARLREEALHGSGEDVNEPPPHY
jgi:SlyX protein